MSEFLIHYFSFSGPVVLEKKISKVSSLYKHLEKVSPL
jgi:hypothetical protein